jgi:hypothetical protein
MLLSGTVLLANSSAHRPLRYRLIGPIGTVAFACQRSGHQVVAKTGSVLPFMTNAVLRIMQGPQLPQCAAPLS